MKSFVIHTETQAQYDFWVDWFKAKNLNELTENYWAEYKDQTCISIENGKLQYYFLLRYYEANPRWGTIYHATEIDKICAALNEPEIKCGTYPVKFNPDKSIDVGCVHMDFDTIKQIYERVKGE